MVQVHMSNGILERQNEENNILKLAAQRQLYSDIYLIGVVNIILTVIVPLTLSFVYSFVVDKSSNLAIVLNTVACCLSLLMVVIAPIIDLLKINKKVLAATIQQQFDVDVFMMNWDIKLFGKRKNLNSEIARSSKKIFENQEKKQLLKNWYVKEVDELSLEDGIAACQKENFTWDRGLRKKYFIFLFIVLTIILVIQISIALVNGHTIREFICFEMFPVLSVLTWIVKTISEIIRDLELMKSLSDYVYSNEKKNMDELTFIQKDIFECRKTLTKIPDWFYQIFKDNDENIEQKAVQMRIQDK